MKILIALISDTMQRLSNHPVHVYDKDEILFNPRNASLNQRSEFFTHCRHKSTILLSGNNGPA